ncbi:MAG: GDP-L-fucose synthase [Chloroflexi bacterium]|nr:GDP-L-fucose synthase [Chloroflexota bacterium]
MEKDSRIFVACHETMIGAAILRRLRVDDFGNVLTIPISSGDLTDQKMVAKFFMEERPEYVFLPSAKVGGILANSRYPAEFIYTNIQSQTNVVHAAWRAGVKKLLFFASSCVYPKSCPQPMRENSLLTGKLEPTNEPYAIAKIAGIEMCQSYNRQYSANFISVVPADVYGPADDFNPETGHVLAALIAKTHRAKTLREPEVVVWGTGSPRRECLHVDDLADACLFLMNSYDSPELINIGSGEDIPISEMAKLIVRIAGFEGKLVFDHSKPDGMPRKLLDTTRLKALGWSPKISLEDGIRKTYEWFTLHGTERKTHSAESTGRIGSASVGHAP